MLTVRYLPVNQAWAVCWFGSVLRIFNTRQEAEAEMADILAKAGI